MRHELERCALRIVCHVACALTKPTERERARWLNLARSALARLSATIDLLWLSVAISDDERGEVRSLLLAFSSAIDTAFDTMSDLPPSTDVPGDEPAPSETPTTMTEQAARNAPVEAFLRSSPSNDVLGVGS
jgi:hypothetical protein